MCFKNACAINIFSPLQVKNNHVMELQGNMCFFFFLGPKVQLQTVNSG
jgi:hypothetical protein